MKRKNHDKRNGGKAVTTATVVWKPYRFDERKIEKRRRTQTTTCILRARYNRSAWQRA